MFNFKNLLLIFITVLPYNLNAASAAQSSISFFDSLNATQKQNAQNFVTFCYHLNQNADHTLIPATVFSQEETSSRLEAMIQASLALAPSEELKKEIEQGFREIITMIATRQREGNFTVGDFSELMNEMKPR